MFLVEIENLVVGICKIEGEEIKSFVLNILNLRCLQDIQSEKVVGNLGLYIKDVVVVDRDVNLGVFDIQVVIKIMNEIFR